MQQIKAQVSVNTHLSEAVWPPAAGPQWCDYETVLWVLPWETEPASPGALPLSPVAGAQSVHIQRQRIIIRARARIEVLTLTCKVSTFMCIWIQPAAKLPVRVYCAASEWGWWLWFWSRQCWWPWWRRWREKVAAPQRWGPWRLLLLECWPVAAGSAGWRPLSLGSSDAVLGDFSVEDRESDHVVILIKSLTPLHAANIWLL